MKVVFAARDVDETAQLALTILREEKYGVAVISKDAKIPRGYVFLGSVPKEAGRHRRCVKMATYREDFGFGGFWIQIRSAEVEAFKRSVLDMARRIGEWRLDGPNPQLPPFLPLKDVRRCGSEAVFWSWLRNLADWSGIDRAVVKRLELAADVGPEAKAVKKVKTARKRVRG